MTDRQFSPFHLGLPIAIDVLSAAALLALPSFGQRLETPSGANTLLLGAGYVLFALGVIFLRRLKPLAEPDEWLSPRARGILALLFALALTTAIAWQLGFFASLGQVNTRELGEGPTAVYFVFAPGAWLGVSLLYIIFLAFRLTPTIEGPGASYNLRAAIGLIAAALMLLLMAAQGRAMLPEGSSPAWVPVGFAVLAVLFLPPRILYAGRVAGRGRGAMVMLASLLSLCAICAFWAVIG